MLMPPAPNQRLVRTDKKIYISTNRYMKLLKPHIEFGGLLGLGPRHKCSQHWVSQTLSGSLGLLRGVVY